MKKELIGTVEKLYIKKDKKRINKDFIIVDKLGVQDDKFYNKDINRSVLLTSISSYELAKKHNINIKYGLLDENILISCDIYKYNIKTQIIIGEVILQISQNCTICDHLNKIDEKLPELLKKDRGIFVKVIKDGIIKKNDKVFLLN